ncbi:MAG: phosphoenolpyruvate--protein phosphotransferase, partial [Candidatus Nanohaloarchaea archaeon]|nr:phosphoenolpyruvate--protein phosphotransferase [Candidatus Nanohaloarchaea archaeon]
MGMSERWTLDGTGVTRRKGHGTVFWYRPREEVEYEEAEEVDAEEEMERFREAKQQAEEELQAMVEEAGERIGEDEAEIFEADPQIAGSVEEEVEAGKSAEQAVEDGFEEPIQRLANTEGGVISERADDLRDIRDRLLRILTGTEHPDLSHLEDGTVLVAERLTPSDTSQLDPDSVAGFVTGKGGKTSHAAIIAKSLGIPAVVGAGERIDEVPDGAEVVVDAAAGKVIVNPDEEDVKGSGETEEADVIEEAVATADDRDIEVAANVGNETEIGNAVEKGADGIGLFRTEFMFLNRDEPPTEEEHLDVYRAAVEEFPDDRVIVRTIDIGGDKPVPYLDRPEEDNPFLGDRGLRFSLGEGRDLFETQVRALLRAASAGDIHVMFPLVSSIEELREAKEFIGEVEDGLEDEGVEHGELSVGIMVETPASVLRADDFAEEADFM